MQKNVHTTFRKRAERLMYNIFTSCIANFFNLPSHNNKLKYLRKYCTAWKLHVYGIFLLRIFPHLDWIRRDTLYTLYLSVFTPNTAKCELEKFCIRTLFTQRYTTQDGYSHIRKLVWRISWIIKLKSNYTDVKDN